MKFCNKIVISDPRMRCFNRMLWQMSFCRALRGGVNASIKETSTNTIFLGNLAQED